MLASIICKRSLPGRGAEAELIEATKTPTLYVSVMVPGALSLQEDLHLRRDRRVMTIDTYLGLRSAPRKAGLYAAAALLIVDLTYQAILQGQPCMH